MYSHVREQIRGCLSGINATVLCYGQTGTGKTYSMMGPPEEKATKEGSEGANVGRSRSFVLRVQGLNSSQCSEPDFQQMQIPDSLSRWKRIGPPSFRKRLNPFPSFYSIIGNVEEAEWK